MDEGVSVLICSDIHYASDAEKRRIHYETRAIENPLSRLLVRFYRHFIWLRDPFAHNHLLKYVLDPATEPGLVVANGDFSCDSAFIGVADPAACESAGICLSQFRQRYGQKFRPVFGDHELGKITLCGGKGGLSLASWDVSRKKLGLEPIWTQRIGKYVLLGITSSLAAMQVYQHEALPEERSEWLEIAKEHLQKIAHEFNQLKSEDKVLLFCHDPTALPYLLEIEAVRSRLPQIEKTIIGHLHSNLIVWQSRVLSGIPHITSCGAAARRITAALSKGKTWRHFNLLLCPALAGIELFRRGGYYTVQIDPSANQPAMFTLHEIGR